MADSSDTIEAALTGPQSVTIGDRQAKAHSLADQIAAARYLAEVDAAQPTPPGGNAKGLGIRFWSTRPQGAVQ